MAVSVPTRLPLRLPNTPRDAPPSVARWMTELTTELYRFAAEVDRQMDEVRKRLDTLEAPTT